MNGARHSQPRRSRAADVGRGDTIVAVATPPGRGAISVVRVSGPDTERIGRKVVRPWPTTPRRVTRCTAVDPRTGGVLDHALAVLFPAPASYTGETVLEVQSHGGMVVAPAIEAAFVSGGARPALPGEFTERAYFHGKIDLIGAEAVRELIEARTRAAHRAAINALSGALARQYDELRESALALEALIAFEIDFPEEDHGPVSRDAVEQAAHALEARLRHAADGALAQKRVRDGTTVVLAGPPNAGKSSLLNALIGEARAIVSDTPGTTRDAIEVLVDGDPWPLRYVDTAGLRDDPDTVERLGIEVSERYLRGADIVVLCTERAERGPIERRIRGITHADLVTVRTKSDLGPTRERGTVVASGVLDVSSITGDGIAQLRQRIMDVVSAQAGGIQHSDAAISARQQVALDVALHEVQDFIAEWCRGDLPTPVVGTHLRAAVTALEDLVGSIDADEVLARVFSMFCVGK